MNPILRIAFFSFLIFAEIHLFAQQHVLTNYSLEKGLPQSSVLTSYQDNMGYIWFGTQGGVSKYNGQKFTNFDTRHGLADNHITAIYQDRLRRYWLGHRYKGLSVIIKDEIFTIPLTDSRINSIDEDKLGNIWIGTLDKGLYILPAGKEIHAQNFVKIPANDQFDLHRIFDILFIDNTGYFGSADGLFSLNTGHTLSEFNFEKIKLENASDGNEGIYSIIQNGNHLWCLSKSGLHSVSSNQKDKLYKTIFFPFSNEIDIYFLHNITVNREGVIWGAYDMGIFRFEEGEFVFDFYGTGYRNNKTNSVLCDMENNIWIGTMNLGVFKYTGDRFRIYDKNDGMTNNVVLSIIQSKTGKVWAATEKGISVFDGSEHRLFSPGTAFNGKPVQVVFEDSRGNIWIGYYDGPKLFRYDPEKGSIRAYTRDDGLKTTSVITIEEGPDGDIWFATLGIGVSRYTYPKNSEPGFFRTYTREDGLCSNSFWIIHRDKEGVLWFGSDNEGLTRYDGDKFYSYNEKDGLTNLSPGALTHDSFNNLWIGSIGGGIFKFDGTKFINYSLEYGLSSDSPFSIICDNNDIIWIGTNSGIDRFDPKTETFEHYGREEGFLGIENNQNAIFKSKDGIIWFGTMNGIVMFDPAKDAINQIPPVTKIDNIKLFFSEFDLSEYSDTIDEISGLPLDLKLKHNLNHLTFECIGISLTAPEKVKYRYMLDNFDSDWNPVTSATSITYTNLPPGDYTFLVKASNNNGVWNASPVALPFAIVPPFWQTWWFKVLMIFVISSIIYSTFLFRIKTIKDQKLKLEELVNKKTIELKHEAQERKAAQLRAEESDKLKTAFLANMSHEIRTPVNAIMGFSELMRDPQLSEEKRKEYLNYVTGGGKLLLNLINDIIDISKIEAGQLRIAEEPCDLNSFMSDMFMTFHELKKQKNKTRVELIIDNHSRIDNMVILTDPLRLKQVLSNLLNNAIKFTEKGYIEFGYKVQDMNNLLFFVKDTGIGIPKDKFEIIFERFRQVEDAFTRNYDGTGLGLSISRKLINLMGGKMWVESVVDNGSAFYFTIPFETTSSKSKIMEKENNTVDLTVLRGKKALVVEDEDSNYILIENMINGSEIEIKRATNGIEAVDLFRKNKESFDLVLMDIKIPGKNGYEATKEIKQMNPNVPVIAQTAYALSTEKQNCIDAGCDDYLSKPYTKTELLSVMQKHISACHAYY